ncbi:nickel ABC transporter permease [Anaerosacchariphilus polymeriproducens]|uniref:Nickel import system permease protein NikB n=1 Tax=Anaerosacchariphilus polymeriproducens TaxID=1812858 RepID=A0A371AZA9_9FIRM|nr:nickel ABC transporter permease [Anaerosacchariphilus polymeriproducens]RDU24935.1 ABC transporter permease [Anaerosacchariphilus polymeriproducens]
MKHYITKRLLLLIPIILGLTFLTFALLYITPGDPAKKKLSAQGIAVTNEVLEKTRQEMGLNQPFMKQYLDWFGKFLKGDLGNSFKDGTSVADKLSKGMRYTFILSFSAFFLAITISIPLGIYTAVKQNRFVDYFIRFLCFIGNAVPNFLLAVLFIYFFCIYIKVFPVVAKGNMQGLFLPALSLALPLVSRFIRQIRAAVLEQLNAEYITGARARGNRETYILFRDVLHNALISIISIFGFSIGTLLGGSVVIESIFMWPGVGKLMMDSINARDYPVIQGFVIISAMIYVVVNLLIDLCYQLIDPRGEE